MERLLCPVCGGPLRIQVRYEATMPVYWGLLGLFYRDTKYDKFTKLYCPRCNWFKDPITAKAWQLERKKED